MATIDRDQLLSDTKLYLPEQNALSDEVLTNIINHVVDNDIPADDDIYYSEALCKTLRAAALLNKAKFAVDTANIKREKVGNHELESFEGANRFSWDDYIKSLADVCPYLPGGGYTPSTSIGAKISPSEPFVINKCTGPDDLIF